MALDQEDLQWISSDLSNLSKFETEEALSGRKAELSLKYFGYEWAPAALAKQAAERRLLILPSLGIKGSSRWQEHCVELRDCIKRLDAYIAEQVER